MLVYQRVYVNYMWTTEKHSPTLPGWFPAQRRALETGQNLGPTACRVQPFEASLDVTGVLAHLLDRAMEGLSGDQTIG